MKNVRPENSLLFCSLLLTLLGAAFFQIGCAKAEPADKAQPFVSENRADCSFPAQNGAVGDDAGALSRAAVERLEKRLSKFKTEREIEFSVTFVETTGDESIDDYSLRLARCREIGARSAGGGILLLVAKNDRKWRTRVTRNLEKDFHDDFFKRLGAPMGEQFKLGNYDRGVEIFVGDLIAELEKK